MLMWWGGDPNPKRCVGTYVPLTPTGGVRGPAFPPFAPPHQPQTDWHRFF